MLVKKKIYKIIEPQNNQSKNTYLSNVWLMAAAATTE
jgi:hypothetical protein